MSTNATEMIPGTDEVTRQELVLGELADRIRVTFRYIILPCTSVLGIAGNVISIVILTRQGFKKCSRILLLALAVSDVLFLTGKFNIPMYIHFGNVPRGFMFSERVNNLCYILFMLFYFAHAIGLNSALLIPVLITGERLLAICCPFRARLILTPQRTIISVSCIYMFSAAYFLYRGILCVQFQQFVFGNVTIGLIGNSDLYFRAAESGLDEVIGSINNHITGVIPVSLVTSGCIVIGIKVLVFTNRRKQLTARQVKLTTTHLISKTTKTLLSICVLYMVCNGFAFIFGYVSTPQLLDQESAVMDIIYSFQDWLLCLNSVGDFIIYVGANNKYGLSTICPTRIRRLKEAFP